MALFIRSLLLVSLALLIAIPSVHATEQTPDRITVNGRTAELQVNPLDAYLKAHPDRQPKATSSANWRGYLADWSIVDNQLLLTRIYREDMEERDGEIIHTQQEIHGAIMPNTELPVQATWFSGVLIVGHGGGHGDAHMGYSQHYGTVELFRIEAGVVTKSVQMDGAAFHAERVRQFKVYRATPAYQAKLKNDLAEMRAAEEAHRTPLKGYAPVRSTDEELIEVIEYVDFQFSLGDYYRF